MRSIIRKEASERRATYREKALEIVRKTDARRIENFDLPSGSELFRVVGPSGRIVVIVIGDEGCEHYVQGGAKWEDLERDLTTAQA